jgi:Zn-dependent peptidase ImmA (M78 family)
MVLQHESGEKMDNVFVRLDSMPAKIKGYVVLDENGDYNVFINKDLNYEQQMKALAHEIVHIDNAHLRVQLPIIDCENEAS